MSGKPSSSSSPSPSGSSGPRSSSRSLSARLAIFLLKLAILTPLLFYLWGFAQPYYSAGVAGMTNGLLALEEQGERVTTLRPVSGERVIQVYSTLREDGQAAGSFDADILHFYLVLCVAMVLSLPEPKGWRRLGALAATMAVLFVFHTVALLITVEHTYAVSLVKIAERIYTPAESAVYKWLKETFVYFAVQLVPALTLLVLVAKYGGLGRALSGLRASGEQGREAAEAAAGRPPRKLGRQAALAVLLLAAAGLWIHHEKVVARQAESLCVKGYAALASDRFALAEEQFQGAIDRNPSFFEARTGLGHALLKEGNAARAEETFREAARMDPNNLGALLGVANCQTTLGRTSDAIASYRNAVSAHPESWEAHYNLGLTLEKASNLEQAETELASAAELNPGFSPVRIDLAQTLRKLGRACDALPHLEAYLQLEPDSPRAEAVKAIVAGLRPGCGSSGS